LFVLASQTQTSALTMEEYVNN